MYLSSDKMGRYSVRQHFDENYEEDDRLYRQGGTNPKKADS